MSIVITKTDNSQSKRIRSFKILLISKLILRSLQWTTSRASSTAILLLPARETNPNQETSLKNISPDMSKTWHKDTNKTALLRVNKLEEALTNANKFVHTHRDLPKLPLANNLLLLVEIINNVVLSILNSITMDLLHNLILTGARWIRNSMPRNNVKILLVPETWQKEIIRDNSINLYSTNNRKCSSNRPIWVGRKITKDQSSVKARTRLIKVKTSNTPHIHKKGQRQLNLVTKSQLTTTPALQMV